MKPKIWFSQVFGWQCEGFFTCGTGGWGMRGWGMGATPKAAFDAAKAEANRRYW